jgi:hypothetical protein
MVSASGKMLVPERVSHQVQNIPRTLGGFRSMIFRPITKRTLQPNADRYAEAHLESLNQLRRDMPVKNLTQRPFRLSVCKRYGERKRKSGFDDPAREGVSQDRQPSRRHPL